MRGTLMEISFLLRWHLNKRQTTTCDTNVNAICKHRKQCPLWHTESPSSDITVVTVSRGSSATVTKPEAPSKSGLDISFIYFNLHTFDNMIDILELTSGDTVLQQYDLWRVILQCQKPRRMEGEEEKCKCMYWFVLFVCMLELQRSYLETRTCSGMFRVTLDALRHPVVLLLLLLATHFTRPRLLSWYCWCGEERTLFSAQHSFGIPQRVCVCVCRHTSTKITLPGVA